MILNLTIKCKYKKLKINLNKANAVILGNKYAQKLRFLGCKTWNIFLFPLNDLNERHRYFLGFFYWTFAVNSN